MSIEQLARMYPPMWTIYDHPRDCPDSFVVRLYYGETATDSVSRHATLVEAREQCAINGGSLPLPRDPDDDSVIVETWI